MKTINYRDGEESRNLVRFKTTEYVSSDDFGDGDVAISWTTLMSFAEALEFAARNLENDGEFEVYISATNVDPHHVNLSQAREMLSSVTEVDFMRVDSRSESLTLGPAVEEVAFSLRELSIITGEFNHNRITQMMEQSGSAMICANIAKILRSLSIADPA